MKLLYLLTSIFIGLSLSACACKNQAVMHDNTIKTAQVKKKIQDPTKIALGLKSHSRYTVLGKEIVSKYNANGIKRQDAIIHDAMRKLAADAGGDAVINIKHGSKIVEGTIVAFDKETV